MAERLRWRPPLRKNTATQNEASRAAASNETETQAPSRAATEFHSSFKSISQTPSKVTVRASNSSAQRKKSHLRHQSEGFKPALPMVAPVSTFSAKPNKPKESRGETNIHDKEHQGTNSGTLDLYPFAAHSNRNSGAINCTMTERPMKSTTSAPIDALHSETRWNDEQMQSFPPNVNPSSSTESGLLVSEVVASRFENIFAMDRFNRMQSKVLPALLNSDENVVISAPTGAGKTVTLELALIRMLSQDTGGKAVYMAPTKALCSEREEDWKRKFGPLGINVQMWTGDISTEEESSLTNIKSADVILTTPEKWHSTTKSWRNENESEVAKSCRLILIDEAHFLNDSPRGATLEASICRMQTIHEGAKQAVRFVAISATIPNINDLAKWIGAGTATPALQFKFGEEYRPVKLDILVESYPDGNNPFAFDKLLEGKLGDVVLKHNRSLKPTLVFVSTRKGCISSAEAVLKSSCRPHLISDAEHRQRLAAAASVIRDRKLQDLFCQGVGIHHAGLDSETRLIVEDGFKKGQLRMLFATSTLAQGVNLPAYMVVVKNTMQYQKGGMVEVSEHSILQMMGRAGRPQFEKEGKAIIMTRSSQRVRYENLSSGNQLVESNLKDNMLGHIVGEIALGTITDLPTVLSWLKYSFFWVRVQQDPETYDIVLQASSSDELEQKLQELTLKDIEKLVDVGAVAMDDDMMLTATHAGKQMAKWSVSYETFKILKEDCLLAPPLSPMGDLILGICKIKELSSIILRSNEKTSLRKMNKPTKKEKHLQIRFPIAGTGAIKTPAEKISVLFQATLGNIDFAKLGPIQLTHDVDAIFSVGKRISSFLLDLLTYADTQPTSAERFLQLLRIIQGFNTRLWYDSDNVGRQIKGVGRVLAAALIKSQLTSYERLANSTSAALEMAMSKSAPFGSTVLKELQSWPVLDLSIKTKEESDDRIISVAATAVSPEAIMSSSKYVLSWVMFAVSDATIMFASRVFLWQLRRGSGRVVRSFRIPKMHNSVVVHMKCIDYIGLDRKLDIDGTVLSHRFSLKIDELLSSPEEDHILANGSEGKPETPNRPSSKGREVAITPSKRADISAQGSRSRSLSGSTLESFLAQAKDEIRFSQNSGKMTTSKIRNQKQHSERYKSSSKASAKTTSYKSSGAISYTESSNHDRHGKRQQSAVNPENSDFSSTKRHSSVRSPTVRRTDVKSTESSCVDHNSFSHASSKIYPPIGIFAQSQRHSFDMLNQPNAPTLDPALQTSMQTSNNPDVHGNSNFIRPIQQPNTSDDGPSRLPAESHSIQDNNKPLCGPHSEQSRKIEAHSRKPPRPYLQSTTIASTRVVPMKPEKVQRTSMIGSYLTGLNERLAPAKSNPPRETSVIMHPQDYASNFSKFAYKKRQQGSFSTKQATYPASGTKAVDSHYTSGGDVYYVPPQEASVWTDTDFANGDTCNTQEDIPLWSTDTQLKHLAYHDDYSLKQKLHPQSWLARENIIGPSVNDEMQQRIPYASVPHTHGDQIQVAHSKRYPTQQSVYNTQLFDPFTNW